MKSSKSGQFHFVKLDKGESVLESITAYINEHNIKSATLSAIGVLKEVELGYYELATGKYVTKYFEHDLELLSLNGNVGTLNGKQHPHVHVVLGDSGLNCVGGHLLKAKVGVTCELFITESNMALERLYDENIKLNLLSPSQVEVKK